MSDQPKITWRPPTPTSGSSPGAWTAAEELGGRAVIVKSRSPPEQDVTYRLLNTTNPAYPTTEPRCY